MDLGPLVSIVEFKNPAYSFYVASLVVNTLALFTVRDNAAWLFAIAYLYLLNP